MLKKINKCLLIYVLLPIAVWAQERPTIEVFKPIDYGAETQNWSISQSENKNVYVANNKGLLEYNGAEWRLYNSPNESIIRSVSVIGNLIYTGSNREFGYWKRNKFGLLDYTSLSKKLNINFLEDEEFWNIVGFDDYILFQSLNRIYIYNQSNKSYSYVESKTGITKLFVLNKSIYFQKNKLGLYKIENGKSVLVSNDSLLKEHILTNVFDYWNNGLLIGTEDAGFYVLYNNVLKPWNVPANKMVIKENVYRCIQLLDKSLIVGTRSNGILHITSKGKVDYSINILNGLSNNTIHYIFEDQEQNIWLALNNGINCVNIKSPFSVYNDEKGKIGTVNASAVLNNIIYLGSNQGLFYKPINEDVDFNFIEGTQGAVWSLTDINGTLFCGHDSGTFIVSNNKVSKISNINGTWNILQLSENLLLQGNYDGLYVLENKNGNWQLRNKIEGFNLSSRFFEISKNGDILLNHEYRGVYKLKTNTELTKAISVNKLEAIKSEINSSLIKYQNTILYTCKNGVFKFNESENQFKKDTLLSKLIVASEYTSGKLLFDNKTNSLFSFSRKSLNYVLPGKLTNTPIINKISYSESLPRGQAGYENISNIYGKKYLIGTSSGFVVVDLDKLFKKRYRVNISSITKNDINSKPINVNKVEQGLFKNKENNIVIRCNVAEYDKFFDAEYQYQLEGLFRGWNVWDSNAIITFENLPFGDYVFKVRARIGNNISENIETYKFTIQKPWFLTNFMMVTYAILVLLFSLFMHNIYKRYYRKQREKLLENTMRELELKELENKQQLMRFKNEKLKQDIENKNRELGISTMSLIKKNEFLNRIKEELTQVSSQDKGGLKNVIKIIDKNLNNTDDWHLFEEAFNNADQDFLKKIKSLHPTLTSNDLRLCAYLRLNLSSKEIAPLLNISPRSVEVKRYRLRKKMNLEHDHNLSDYILEI